MADPKKSLMSKFDSQKRFANFGPVIVKAKINGFRGVNAEINFEYPVTALSGFNGSGKSTIGQLLLCGYKKLPTALNAKRYYVVNFFPVSAADPTPFTDEAFISLRAGCLSGADRLASLDRMVWLQAATRAEHGVRRIYGLHPQSRA
ncbi:ATP-binding protein [Rhizobium leguminosarum]|uniref:ATP-binding protein n=1 Tax=Rhizobium leguminosarum TaxID=384 RepID=UPI003CFE7145